MADYHDHYLKKDVLLLADVFEKSIDTCLKFYKLDPCHYFSSPGLSRDEMLKMTDVEFKKISDIEMYLFIEKGLRGGISYIAKKHSKANNKYMKNYVFHYKNLQLYLFLGRKLTKIHKVLKFKQSDWMKNYINFNTEKRKNAAKSFEINLFKLMINNAYGKTMENLRKRINVRLVNNEKDFLKYTSKPTHITHKIFDKNYAAIHEIKPVLTLNKPIYVGFTVLELSKWLMYDFHYNFIKKHFDAELLFTDTDSLTYEIKSEDIYE